MVVLHEALYYRALAGAGFNRWGIWNGATGGKGKIPGLGKFDTGAENPPIRAFIEFSQKREMGAAKRKGPHRETRGLKRVYGGKYKKGGKRGGPIGEKGGNSGNP